VQALKKRAGHARIVRGSGEPSRRRTSELRAVLAAGIATLPAAGLAIRWLKA